MKKIFAAGLLAAASLSAYAAPTTIYAPGLISGSSFTDATIGTITVGSLSDIVGNVFAADSVTFMGMPVSLDHVTFTSATVGSLTDLDPSAAGFSFHNVAAGTYTIKASGMLDNSGMIHGTALGASYSVTAVPEPETYGMLLAGLGVMGLIARRKAKKAA